MRIDTIDLRACATGAQASGSTGCAPIRYAAALSGVFAFVLLCALSSDVGAALNLASGASGAGRSTVPVVTQGTVLAQPTFDADSAQADAAEAEVEAAINATRPAPHITRGGSPFATGAHAPAAQVKRVMPSGSAMTSQILMLLLAGMTAIAVVAALTAFRLRIALTRFRKRWQRLESDWQRRCAAAQAREQAAQSAQALVVTQVTNTIAQARRDMLANLRREVATPLIAMTGLLESPAATTMTSAQWPFASTVLSALRTGVHVLDDVLDPHDPPGAEGRTIILDESETDLRDLIDGAIALFSMSVAQNGLHLKVRVDRSADLQILVDGARLGQIIFHLLSEALRSAATLFATGEIEFVAWAEALNGGSHRVFLSATSSGNPSGALARAPVSPRAGTGTSEKSPDDTRLALCRALAARMHGEMTVVNDPDFGTRWTFSAPFATNASACLARPPVHHDLTRQPCTATLNATQAEAWCEPFDRHYLDALAGEGVDLHIFLRGWRHSVEDDLAQLKRAHGEDDIEGLHAVLHRLSGAVGMVGGRSLMDALQGGVALQSGADMTEIDALVRRTRRLMAQLDAVLEQRGSNVQ